MTRSSELDASSPEDIALYYLYVIEKFQAIYKGYSYRKKLRNELLLILLENKAFDLIDTFQSTNNQLNALKLSYFACSIQKKWRLKLQQRKILTSAKKIANWIVRIYTLQKNDLLWLVNNHITSIYFIDFYKDDVMTLLTTKFNPYLESGDVSISTCDYIRSHIVRSLAGRLYQVFRRCMTASTRPKRLPHISWWTRLASPSQARVLQLVHHRRRAVPTSELHHLQSVLQKDKDRYQSESSSVLALHCTNSKILHRIIRELSQPDSDVPLQFDCKLLQETAAVTIQKIFRSYRYRYFVRYCIY
jgi:hypothetical protein